MLDKKVEDINTEAKISNDTTANSVDRLRTQTLAFSESTNKSISNIMSDLGDYKIKLETQNNQILSLGSSISEIKRLPSASGSQNNIDAEDIYAELQDRARRRDNLILFNLTEVDEAKELESVKSILSKIQGHNLGRIVCRRVGKSGDKPRPLVVTMSSFNEVLTVLKYKKLLPTGISIPSDKTHTQKKYLDELIEKMDADNAKSPDDKLIIRYRFNKPYLTSINNTKNVIQTADTGESTTSTCVRPPVHANIAQMSADTNAVPKNVIKASDSTIRMSEA